VSPWVWHKGPLCIGDPGSNYNGFDWERRCLTTPVQKAAVRAGRIRQPTTCGITGTGTGYVFMHLEDYTQPLDFYPVGRSAHHLLHQRFTDPLPWMRLVRHYYVHGAWFTLLSMDPADMARPFAEVYPQGLPREGECWPGLADELGLTPAHFAVSVEDPSAAYIGPNNLFRSGR
jgi:hypothetical protein